MKVILRTVLTITISLIVVMWVYGLFFASKQAVNKFDDRNWATKAQARCLIAEVDHKALADYRVVDDLGATIEDFVKEFRVDLPSDPKGKAIVSLWLDDYEIYISDRRSFTDDLRSGVNKRFAETPLQGLPISEKIATFAADNEMSYCKPPIDLSL